MEIIIEVVRMLTGLTTEKLTLMLAFAALGVAAMAVSTTSRNKDR